MSTRTRFLSKLIGLYSILVSLSMAMRRQATVDVVTALIHNPPVLYLAGVMALTAGLAIVLSHNLWSGGALPVIVTLVGWASLLKGLLLMSLSPEGASEVYLGALHYAEFFYLYDAILFLLGAYLTFGSRANQHLH